MNKTEFVAAVAEAAGVSKKDTESVEINSYLAYMFDEDEIEDILLAELKKLANSRNVAKLRDEFVKENSFVFRKG